MKNDFLKDYPTGDLTRKCLPTAEEVVDLLADKKMSYAEAEETLRIALNGIKTLTLQK
jgi:hypothetical protein